MRLSLVVMVLLLALSTSAAAVPPSYYATSTANPFADEVYDPGAGPSSGFSNADDFIWNATTQQWVPDDSKATSFNGGPAWGTNGAKSNVAYWSTQFKTTASVAQWVNFNLSATQKEWFILQPGTYASDCISFFLQSNNDVLLTFEGFGPLVHQVNYTGQDESVNTQIPISYGFGDGPATLDANNAWAVADGRTFYFSAEDSLDLHNGFTTKMFSKIDVVNCNTSSQYEDEGTITLTLQNVKVWVDGEVGTYEWAVPTSPI